jgi:hypothetical protein
MAFVDHGTDAVPIGIAGQALPLCGDRLQSKAARAGNATPFEDHAQTQFENFTNGYPVTRRINLPGTVRQALPPLFSCVQFTHIYGY